MEGEMSERMLAVLRELDALKYEAGVLDVLANCDGRVEVRISASFGSHAGDWDMSEDAGIRADLYARQRKVVERHKANVDRAMEQWLTGLPVHTDESADEG